VLLPANLSLATHTLMLSDRSGSDLLRVDSAVHFYLSCACYQPVKISANNLAEHLCHMCFDCGHQCPCQVEGGRSAGVEYLLQGTCTFCNGPELAGQQFKNFVVPHKCLDVCCIGMYTTACALVHSISIQFKFQSRVHASGAHYSTIPDMFCCLNLVHDSANITLQINGDSRCN